MISVELEIIKVVRYERSEGSLRVGFGTVLVNVFFFICSELLILTSNCMLQHSAFMWKKNVCSKARYLSQSAFPIVKRLILMISEAKVECYYVTPIHK